jgi:hypothetical protein
VSAVNAAVASGLPGWIARRHDLRRRPRLGFIEYCTTARLAALGYDVRVGQQVMRADALIGRPDAETIEAPRTRSAAAGDGPVVAMRFDIDALRLIEAEDDGHGMVARSRSRRWAARSAPSPVPTFYGDRRRLGRSAAATQPISSSAVTSRPGHRATRFFSEDDIGVGVVLLARLLDRRVFAA